MTCKRSFILYSKNENNTIPPNQAYLLITVRKKRKEPDSPFFFLFQPQQGQ